MIDFSWGSKAHPLRITASADTPVMASIAEGVVAVEPVRRRHRARPGLVEVLAVGYGRGLNNMRAIRTSIGDGLRYVRHTTSEVSGGRRLEIEQRHDDTGLVVRTVIDEREGVDAYRFHSVLHNGGEQPVILQQVTSAALIGITGFVGDADETDLWSAQSEWCAESRWAPTPLRGPAGLADINTAAHGHFARGGIARVGRSTWPTGEHLPTGVLSNRTDGRTLAWEIENNGPWRWELDALYDPDEALALALLGPTDIDHSWLKRLESGEEFVTVSASIALSTRGIDGALAALTAHRRGSRIPSPAADAGHPLIFNDYMNALMGDPTREKLLPLIDAAAEAGARYFCIDAGWYDDGGDWWPSVGEWQPSTVRFGPEGLIGILRYIRDRGMTPGLWVEPEVVGVRSAVAESLPDEAFMYRQGVRIIEHDRYLLDMRSAAARDHLDTVFRRLIEEYGAGYFKWDYNVTPGTGPDANAVSAGDGLLEHSRALLNWVEGLRQRYPDVVLEACSSGAQRMDSATLARYDLQSTTDQQDYRLYPPIAAAAPMSMPIEMAGNWAYPQPEWSLEQVAFTLVTGLSGRLYLSGHLNELDAEQFALVREAAALYPSVIAHHARADACWPLGLPAWDAPQVVLGSRTDDETLLFIWNRDSTAGQTTVPLPEYRGAELAVDVLFPRGRAVWRPTWDAGAAELQLDFAGAGESARVVRIRPENRR